MEAPGKEGGNALYSGSLIVNGHGSAVVTATGERTVLGRIGAALSEARETKTPLEQTTGRVVALLGALALAFCVGVAGAYGLMRGNWVEGILAGLTVAIALIPEEVPMILTVFLALGAWRLAQHKVLVRRNAVVEALGGATMLCVDKTGTLTENRMTVAAAWSKGKIHPLEGHILPESVGDLLDLAVLASTSTSADPIDQAVIKARGLGAISGLATARTWPVRPERMALIRRWTGPGPDILAAKGAPEAIFRLCRLGAPRVTRLEAAVTTMAEQGMRVLAVAFRRSDGPIAEDPADGVFRFAGLVGFLDPVRAEVPDAIKEARRAGIKVVMITGDYPATALEIARQAGIDSSAGVMTGTEIATMSASNLASRLKEVRIFARVQPDQKLRLIETFKAAGEVVAMTGDGVNDAPALEAADIGIAMGLRGADVAREAADLVLLDDGFGSIVGGIRLGRRIFSNLRKALIYVTAVHLPVAGLALVPILLGWPPLLLPMQVVLLELVIDPMCSLVFEAEPSEAEAMNKPPRRRTELIFGPSQLGFALLQGVIMLAAVLLLYGAGLRDASEPQARGAAFASLVVANLALALANMGSPGVRLFDKHRGAYAMIVATAGVVLAAVLYAPALTKVFHVASPTGELLLGALAVGVAAGGWRGVVRFARRRGGVQA